MTFAEFSATDLSAAGLLALAVLMVFIGMLIPRYVFNQMRADRDARLAEARAEINSLWTTVHAQDERLALQAQQLGELRELAKTTDQFIRSLQTAARRTEIT